MSEEFQERFGGARQHCLEAADSDGALHQRRVGEEKFHHRFGRVNLVFGQAQFGNSLVSADKVARFVRQKAKQALKVASAQRVLCVVDNIELDVWMLLLFLEFLEFLEQSKSSTGSPSMGIVV